MAQIRHRIDLTKADFPLLSQELGRTVLVSSFKDAPSGEIVNTPQIMYMHNVMPVSSGLRSIGYVSRIPAPIAPNANANFIHVHVIFSEQGNRVLLGITSDGHVYSLEVGDSVWIHIASHPGIGTGNNTFGIVNGITYIYLEAVGIWTYNDVTSTFTPVSFIGLVGTILGITASFGYLIAYTTTAIAWSSTVNPLDFTPSTVTGAGGGNVAEIDGNITFIVPNSLGLLVYTRANVIAATYTGNKQFPFKFREVDNSKGVPDSDLVSYEANSVDHFAYTNAGLQSINSRTASPLLPELTDFLGGRQFEDFNEATSSFTVVTTGSPLLKKVKLISSRYLVISYGVASFTHALIYDIVLKRVGKIKLTHRDVFEYISNQAEPSKESIGFIDNVGAISTLSFVSSDTVRPGVLLLGKYQYSRDRHFILHGLDISRVRTGDTLAVSILVSMDGVTTDRSITPTEVIGTVSRSYSLIESGINHSILLSGEFDLNTIQLLGAVGGRR